MIFLFEKRVAFHCHIWLQEMSLRVPQSSTYRICIQSHAGKQWQSHPGMLKPPMAVPLTVQNGRVDVSCSNLAEISELDFGFSNMIFPTGDGVSLRFKLKSCARNSCVKYSIESEPQPQHWSANSVQSIQDMTWIGHDFCFVDHGFCLITPPLNFTWAKKKKITLW